MIKCFPKPTGETSDLNRVSRLMARGVKAIASVLLLSVALPDADAVEYYHVQNIGALLGATNSYAHGINNSGNVVGYLKDTNSVFRAFFLEASQWTDLGTSGTNSYALSLNDLAHVVDVSSQSSLWPARVSALGQGTIATNFSTYTNLANTLSSTSTPFIGSSSSVWFGGDIAEVFVYDRVFTVDERTSVKNYFTRRFFMSDSDAHGLPDEWEKQYRGNLTDLGPGDYGGDGVSDRDEFFLGTNRTQTDADGDGFLDGEDMYPLDPARLSSGNGLTLPVSLQLLTPLN